MAKLFFLTFFKRLNCLLPTGRRLRFGECRLCAKPGDKFEPSITEIPGHAELHFEPTNQNGRIELWQ